MKSICKISQAKELLLIIVLVLSPSVINAQCPDNNHPHMIDLGLPSGIKWACCNVGTNNPSMYGGWYAWGETEEKENYVQETYKLIENGRFSYSDKEVLAPQDDVAHVKWGGNWRMPTIEEMMELKENTNVHSVKTPNKHIYGYMFTSKINGAFIFLPGGGCFMGDKREDNINPIYTYSRYWSSTHDKGYGGSTGCFMYLQIRQNKAEVSVTDIAGQKQSWSGWFGFQVRPVCK